MKRYILLIVLFYFSSIYGTPLEDLLDASHKGDLNRVEKILQNGNVDINGYLPRNPDADADIIDSDSGYTALIWAISDNNFNIAKLLIRYGADINASGLEYPPIFAAISFGSKEMTDYLLSLKPNLVIVDSNGISLLQEAVKRGKTSYVKFFISKGLDVNSSDNAGQTPLHEASVSDNQTILKILLEHRATVNAQTKLREASQLSKGLHSPLHYASLYGKYKNVKILLAYGADKMMKNGDGETAYDIAKRMGFIKVMRLLN